MHYIAWRILDGAAPYRDLFDMNFPGAYAAHLLLLLTLGPGDLAFRAFDLGILLLVGAGLWSALRASGAWGGLAAAALFALYHVAGGPWLAGQRDLLFCGFLVWSAAGVIASTNAARGRTDPAARRRGPRAGRGRVGQAPRDRAGSGSGVLGVVGGPRPGAEARARRRRPGGGAAWPGAARVARLDRRLRSIRGYHAGLPAPALQPAGAERPPPRDRRARLRGGGAGRSRGVGRSRRRRPRAGAAVEGARRPGYGFGLRRGPLLGAGTGMGVSLLPARALRDGAGRGRPRRGGGGRPPRAQRDARARAGHDGGRPVDQGAAQSRPRVDRGEARTGRSRRGRAPAGRCGRGHGAGAGYHRGRDPCALPSPRPGAQPVPLRLPLPPRREPSLRAAACAPS